MKEKVYKAKAFRVSKPSSSSIHHLQLSASHFQPQAPTLSSKRNRTVKMRFSIILPLVAAVAAFHIPDGKVDGVYEVSYSADGTENHTLISNGDAPQNIAMRGASRATINKRSGVVTCKPNEAILNNSDNGRAATLLANQCGNGATVRGGYDYYSIIGCSVSYFCNFKSNTQVCTSLNAWTSFNNINNACGVNIPGYETYYDSDGDDSYGYEWFCTSPGNNFCGRGTNGKR